MDPILLSRIKKASSPSDSQVASAVNSYLTKNPVQAYDDTEIKNKIESVIEYTEALNYINLSQAAMIDVDSRNPTMSFSGNAVTYTRTVNANGLIAFPLTTTSKVNITVTSSVDLSTGYVKIRTGVVAGNVGSAAYPALAQNGTTWTATGAYTDAFIIIQIPYTIDTCTFTITVVKDGETSGSCVKNSAIRDLDSSNMASSVQKLLNKVSSQSAYEGVVFDVPNYIDAVAGEPMLLYAVGLMNAKYTELENKVMYNYGGHVFDYAFVDGVMKTNFEKVTSATTTDNRFYVKDLVTGETLLSDKVMFNINAVPSNPSGEKNILMMGDSLYTSKFPEARLVEKLTEHSLTNYKLVGRLTDENNTSVKYEATGGYSWHNYVDDPSTLPSGYPNNYMWNNSTGEIDIQNYMTTYCNGANLDYLLINLGWNHKVNGVYASDTISDIETMANTFLDKVHSQYPNCKILINGIHKSYYKNPPSVYTRERIFELHTYCSNLNALYKKIASERSAYVRFNHVACQFDTDTGCKLSTMTRNPYTSETITYCNDLTHPNDTVGYKMLGDSCWRGFVALTSM